MVAIVCYVLKISQAVWQCAW